MVAVPCLVRAAKAGVPAKAAVRAAAILHGPPVHTAMDKNPSQLTTSKLIAARKRDHLRLAACSVEPAGDRAVESGNSLYSSGLEANA